MAQSKAEELKSELFYVKKHGCLVHDEQTVAAADDFCEGYKAFLDAAKTEREAAARIIAMAEKQGFSAFDRTRSYAPGDRVYVLNRGKAVMLAVIGRQPVANGVRIAAAHIDSPRLDLKQNPLYEEQELALFKTHYYGGIKKYQWTALPLALHGVVVRADGSRVEISLGEREEEPCFVVTDLLPHLATEQVKRTLADGIRGEELNILIGSRPFRDDEASELVKLNIMRLIHEKYGITEADFLSAELELVPALHARDLGFDRSMIGAYGHDDRVCTYPCVMAALSCAAPEKTIVAVLADKEETGSDGNTGLNSAYLEYFICDLAAMQDADGREALSHSECLSADVNAAMDPTFSDVLEPRNAARLNYGASLTKYTGSRGKGGTSDASAEFVGRVRRLLDGAGVTWQTGELGRVDLGGGGTVAMYIANLGADVVDLGVPVLSMHSPFEVVAKFDVYMMYRAVEAFFADKA